MTQYIGDNKHIIIKAFYDALTGGTDVGEAHIASMALALLDRCMLVDWIASNPTVHWVFNWLLVTLQSNAQVPSHFVPGGSPIAFDQALRWVLVDCDASGLDSYAAKLPSDALLVMNSPGHRIQRFTDENSIRLATANNLHKIIEKLMDTQRREHNSSSHNWQRPIQKLVGYVSARKFWRDFKSSALGIESLHGVHSTSTHDMFRCRAVAFLLLKPDHKSSKVPTFVKYLQALDLVLADPKAPLGKESWFDLDASFEAATQESKGEEISNNGASEYIQAQLTPASGPGYDASQHITPAISLHVYTSQHLVSAAHSAAATLAYRTPTPPSTEQGYTQFTSYSSAAPYHPRTTLHPTTGQYQPYHTPIARADTAQQPKASTAVATVTVNEASDDEDEDEEAVAVAATDSSNDGIAGDVQGNQWTWYPKYRQEGRFLASGEFKWRPSNE